MSFKFNLGDEVVIEVSGEKGLVIGRAEYLSSDNTYLIRYAAGDGRAVEKWWNQDALNN